MGISIYKIKRWSKMLSGKSISHVNQGVGTCYSKTDVAGYYNDLTEKVTKDDPDILVPKYQVNEENNIYFSIGVFQYGLGAYDLFLTTGKEIYKNKLIACANWALENQDDDGGWKTFDFEDEKYPYSSMAQGEGISLLIRAHIVTQDERYILAIHKAKDFMLKPLSENGTAEYVGEDVYFYEYTRRPLILNGWIFSLWGLYDYYKYFKCEETHVILDKTLASLKKKLPEYDIKYWSKYDIKKRICSPFYHSLHVAQQAVMYDLFGDLIYKEYHEKWKKYQSSKIKTLRAFCKKAMEKILER